MQQLFFIKRRNLEWRDASEPRLLHATDALVRPFAAARCDLDTAFLLNDLATPVRIGLALHLIDPFVRESIGAPPFEGPFPYGHECVAEVVETGGDVAGFRSGDVVIVPFQISCGSCSNCGRGLTAHCATGRPKPISAFGFGAATGNWGGVVADLVRVPNAGHMLVPVPTGIDPLVLASASDNIPDGWRTVAPHLRAWPGARVLVLGGRAQSVALYAAAAAVALGSEHVDYVDTSRQRLEIAERIGAHPVKVQDAARYFRQSQTPQGRRYPIVVDGSGRAGALTYGIKALAAGGVCTTVCFYLRLGTPVPLWRMYVAGNTLVTGLANVRADLPDILGAVRDGRLNPGLVTTLSAPWDEAGRALLEPSTKVVVSRQRTFA